MPRSPRRLHAVPIGDFDVAIARAVEGERDGFRWLFEQYNRQLAGFVRARGARDVDAVVSETFVRAFARVESFEGSEAGFRGWIFAICRNLLIDDARSEARRPPVTDGSSGAAQVGPACVETEAIEGLDETATALLAALTAEQREVVSLRIIAGLTVDEVSAVLGKPATAVKALQHRALRSLERKIRDSAVSPEGELTLS